MRAKSKLLLLLLIIIIIIIIIVMIMIIVVIMIMMIIMVINSNSNNLSDDNLDDLTGVHESKFPTRSAVEVFVLTATYPAKRG